jgi:hypothetical protein
MYFRIAGGKYSRGDADRTFMMMVSISMMMGHDCQGRKEKYDGKKEIYIFTIGLGNCHHFSAPDKRNIDSLNT